MPYEELNRPETREEIAGVSFRHEITFSPAYDKRTNDPKTNCGIHGVTMTFYLHGTQGVIQFVVYTNWQLPHVQQEFDGKSLHCEFPYLFHKPMPADIGYHSRTPKYEGQSVNSNCHILGGDCYCDGSSLQAEAVFEILLRDGDKGVWREMERRYHSIFDAEISAREKMQQAKS